MVRFPLLFTTTSNPSSSRGLSSCLAPTVSLWVDFFRCAYFLAANSVRGWFDCDLAVGRSFGEATIEYRFPIISIFSGEVFFDAGTDFGSQASVPGKPGQLLKKPGSGVSPGIGVIVTTPVGPLRLEVASQDFTGEWRFNLGVGWKF